MANTSDDFRLEILKLVFPPNGDIPASRIFDIGRVAHHIDKLYQLKIGVQDDDEETIKRIVELRDGTTGPNGNPPTWESIAEILGAGHTEHSVRNRYRRYKKRIYRANKLSDTEKASDQPKGCESESRAEACLMPGPGVTPKSQTLPKTTVAAAIPVVKIDDAEDDGPRSKGMSRAELDIYMWELWNAGKNTAQIKEKLHSEGYYLSESAITSRLNAQGCSINKKPVTA